MVVSGGHLSLFGRTALSNVGGSRVALGPAPEPVDPAYPLKDATSSEYRELQDLKQRDREVRRHEQAHIAAGGSLVRGGASFSYERGTDGRQYAVGGEVQIDTSAVAGDPAATIRKMQAVKRAAIAPADPSAQDRAVAADAARAEAEAQVELREQAGQSGGADHGDGDGRHAQNALSAYRGAADTTRQTPPGPLLDLIA